ncbi:MAG: polysaccharide biosynthesis tyrosine autokinase [Pirellulaceae bacterium]
MTETRMASGGPANPLQDQQRPPEDDDNPIDFRALLTPLWRGKWIILICLLFGATFGYLTASQYDPSYQASAKVMFDAPSMDIIDIGNGATTPVRQNGLQDQIEVLRSTNLAAKVVDELNLVNNPEFNPRLRSRTVTTLDRVRGFFTIPDWAKDTFRDLGLMSPPPPPQPEPDPEEIADFERRVVISTVLGRLSTEPVPNSRVIEISFTSGNRQTASAVANSFAEQYIVDKLDARLEATRAATDWLSGRVDELRERLQAAEEAVESKRAELSFQAGQSLEITQQQLSALNGTLSVARNEARTAQATYERLKSVIEEDADYGTIPKFRNSPVITKHRTRRTELLFQRTTLLENVSEDHPSVQRVDALLEEAARNIRNEAKQIVEAARVEWVSLRKSEAQIEADVRELESLALEQSRAQVAIRQLEREAQASRGLYENFLSRLQETSEQERLEDPGARILTRAQPPISAQMQRQNRTMQISAITGVLVGIGIIFLLEKLNNTFRSAPQLEQVTGETVLGVLPIIGQRLRRKTVLQRFREKPKSSLAEAVRSLRTSILFSNVDTPPRVMMFTSSVPREGKSTTAALVALTSRQMGRSSIIVDCDLRLPALADLFGANDKGPGLLSVVEGTATLDEAIHKDEETKLHVLTTKKSEPRSSVNAADILSSKRFNDLITQLKDTYDLVILDTPPALVVADPKILASHADVVIYVVRWDQTPRGAVLEGLKELKSINAPVAGVVLSMVNEAKASSYAYEGYSYYRGKYRNYYTE